MVAPCQDSFCIVAVVDEIKTVKGIKNVCSNCDVCVKIALNIGITYKLVYTPRAWLIILSAFCDMVDILGEKNSSCQLSVNCLHLNRYLTSQQSGKHVLVNAEGAPLSASNVRDQTVLKADSDYDVLDKAQEKSSCDLCEALKVVREGMNNLHEATK